jgi:hypothetical protein
MLSAWQVELMEQDARNRAWEDLNAPDPDENRKKKAAKSIQAALDQIDKVLNSVYQAVDDVDGLPIADEIESYEETFSDISVGLKTIQGKLQYGWR